MNLIEFSEKYPDEASCQAEWRRIREQEGVICKKCSSTSHYWKNDKQCFECKKCKFRTSLRGGTVMENSHLPFRYWLLAIHLMSSMKKSISALEMQKQLGHKFYEPVWEMMHKIRVMLGKRDNEYELEGTVEVDEGFFKQVKPLEKNELTGEIEDKKRGRGSQQQAKVLVMTSTKAIKDPDKYAKNTALKFVKMKVMEDLTAASIDPQIKQNISAKATVKTDGFKSYTNIKTIVAEHQQPIVPPKMAETVLPWVHTMISNAKRTLNGIHHMIKSDYMQNYLNEFCYKVNRRYFQNNLFDRMLIACVSEPWYK